MGRIIIQFGRSKLILSLIAGIGIIAGYISYSGADDPTAALLFDEPVVKKDDLETFNNFKIDFSILEDERYRSLEIYGENPVDPGITGERTNPFAPI